MGKRNRLYCVLVFAVYLFIFQGCKDNYGRDTVSEVPFIVKSVEEMKLLKSVNFYLKANDLTALPEAIEGACGMGTFNIDFSQYIDSKYYNAEAGSWTWVPVKDITIKEVSDPIATDTIVLAKGCNVIENILFLVGYQMVVPGKEYIGELVYNTLQQPMNNNYQFDLYVSQKGEASEDSLLRKGKIYMTFDLNGFFKKYDVPNKADTFNLGVKYCPGWTPDGLYKYDSIKITPAIIIP